MKILINYVLIFFLTAICFNAAAYGIDSLKVKNPDIQTKNNSIQSNDSILAESDSSLIKKTVDFNIVQDAIRKVADSIALKSSEQFKEKQIYSQQLILLSDLKKLLSKSDDFLKRGIDTAQFNSNLNQIEEEYNYTLYGTSDSSGVYMTSRNFISSQLLLIELNDLLAQKKQKVETYLIQLGKYRKTADSLQTNPIFFTFAKDSALFTQYLQKIILISAETSEIDSNLTKAIESMNAIESRIDKLNKRISSSEDEVKSNIIYIRENITERETSDLWDPISNKYSVKEILNFSYIKGKLILKYFLVNNSKLFILLIAGAALLSFVLFRIRANIKKNKVSAEISKESRFVLKYPVQTASFLTLMFFEFLFYNPPVIFQGLIWIIASVFLTIILWDYFSGNQRLYWLLLLSGFTIALISDVILGKVFFERILLLIIALSGITLSVFALKKKILNENYKTFKVLLLLVSILFFAISIIANVFGRYNASKYLAVTTFFMVVSAYLLYWTMILGLNILELFSLAFDSDGEDDSKSKLHAFKTRTPVFLRIIVFSGWLMLMLRNFYFYDSIIESVQYFLNQERTIGDFTFTVEKILVFFLIILFSTIISKIVAFIAERSDSTHIKSSGQKSTLSNWMLLIRIGVITTGMLLAFAATGIPIDRIVIIIGSLGVGIGLGLQTIVNNLVSGIILAFEKPFRLGDRIEVSNETGKIKEIGIRSSKIDTSNGSVVIIPNGDLLSKVVTNWTMRDFKKRSDVILSFKSVDNLNELKSILQNILDTNEHIYKNPEPLVLLNNISSESSDFCLQYWTDIDKTDKVKSEIMLKIETDFKVKQIKTELPESEKE